MDWRSFDFGHDFKEQIKLDFTIQTFELAVNVISNQSKYRPSFFDHELCSNVLKEAFVVVVAAVLVLVLGRGIKSKNVSNGTKNVREQNLFQIEQKLLLKACTLAYGNRWRHIIRGDRFEPSTKIK